MNNQVPTDLRDLGCLLAKIKKRLADGNRVLIHCFGGMGRAVLVGCCLLMDLDEDIEPGEVIEQVNTESNVDISNAFLGMVRGEKLQISHYQKKSAVNK